MVVRFVAGRARVRAEGLMGLDTMVSKFVAGRARVRAEGEFGNHWFPNYQVAGRARVRAEGFPHGGSFQVPKFPYARACE